MPTVTVVVAVYNIEKYIEKCIRSVIAQTWKDIEILLIDDGSTDSSGNICDSYAKTDDRIRVIHKVNGGISDVRNVGLEKATGSYLMYVDGDDYIAPNYVEKAVKCAEHYKAEVVIFDYQEIEEATGRRECWKMDAPRETKLTIEEYPALLIMTPSPCNKIYRISLWERCGLRYPVGRVYEDLTITPQLLLNAESIVYMESEPLYYYILHEGSIMRSQNFKKSLDNRKAAMENLMTYFKENNMFDRYASELEYLMFEHVYFIPTKEVIYYDSKSEYLEKFRQYVFEIFPKADKNLYVKRLLSKKDRLLLFLMKRRMYCGITLLSKMRKRVDLLRNKK